MSCDLNLRGVKRKLSTVDEIDTGGVECLSLSTENEPIRKRFSSPPSSPPSTSSLAEIKSLVGTVSSNLCNGNQFKPIAVSPNSLSSESMSDDDDEEEDDDDDESGHVDDESYINQTLDDSYGIASAESESGYDERASSNSSSLSDAISTTSDYEFSPIVASSELSTISSSSLSSSSCSSRTASSSIFSSQVDTSSSSSSTCVSTFSPKSVPSSIECNSSGESTNGSSFCAYSNAFSSSNKLSPHYAQRPQSQSYSHINAANQRNKMNYLRQRQQIFNLSMCKLSRFRQSSDPSLHRSVLICNTLRMLEKELEREGLKINFGPNGVSFISPVSTPDLDFLPMLQTPPLPSMSSDCSPSPDGAPVPFSGLPSSDSSEHASYHHHYQTPCDSSTGSNCPEYDKYLQLDSSSPSGRATPFVKTFMSNEPYSNRLQESSMNSAFWGNCDEQMSDRLTSLNWSSMLNFNSSNSLPSTPTSAIPEARHSNQSSSPEVLSNGSMMPYPNEQSSAMSTNNVNSAFSSSCASLSSNSSSATFATLLPPVSTSSMPSMDLASSVTSAHTVQTDSYLFPSNTSSSPTYYSTSSPMYTPQSQPSSANFGATGPVSNSTVSNGPSAAYMSTSYMNSYLNYPTSDEIFGDIDLSLYDFDIFSPLSPPNVANKPPAPIMSAEELIRNINSSECNNMPSTTTTTSSSSPSLISINHHTVNGFSGQSFTSSSYNTSTALSATVSSSITPSSPPINGQLILQQSVTTPSTVQANCGSTSTGACLHLHTASGRYYKTPESEREQITTIKCHN